MGFEPMTPVFERAKTAHGFYRAVTVIGLKDKVAPVLNELSTTP
jgi:hypothetical protein